MPTIRASPHTPNKDVDGRDKRNKRGHDAVRAECDKDRR
jgi:hypothetical protein